MEIVLGFFFCYCDSVFFAKDISLSGRMADFFDDPIVEMGKTVFIHVYIVTIRPRDSFKGDCYFLFRQRLFRKKSATQSIRLDAKTLIV